MSADRTNAHPATDKDPEVRDLGLAVLDGDPRLEDPGEQEPPPDQVEGRDPGALDDPSDDAAHGGRRRTVGSVIGNTLLNLAAACGALCLLAVIAALIFDITLVMFSTGSMSPTIPAGSVAVVREIPAGEVAVGDVVTVDRPGKLPVTHRVVGIETGAGSDQRLLTLRGDANPVDDAQPYPVATVRVVMFSVPKLASVIAALSNPLLLGAITLAAAALVTWAFWPREPGQRSGRHRRSPPPDAPVAAGSIAVVALAATALLLPASRAEAVPGQTVEVIRGSVITLTSIGDRSAMTNLQPGGGAGWQVGVSAQAPEPGRIELSMVVADPDPLPRTGSGQGAASPDGIRLVVRACAERWVGGACAAGGSSLLVAAGADELVGSRPLGVMRSSEQRWLLVRAELPERSGIRPGDRTDVTIVAAGFGDTVRSGPGDLAETGAGDLRLPVVLALAAVLGGIGLTLLARLRLSGAGRRRIDCDHR